MPTLYNVPSAHHTNRTLLCSEKKSRRTNLTGHRILYNQSDIIFTIKNGYA